MSAIFLERMVKVLMRCYECGKNMRKVEDSPETYECECGYTVRQLTTERTKLFVKVTPR